VKTANDNGKSGVLAVAEPKSETASPDASATTASVDTTKQPYVPKDDKQKPSLKENARLAMVGAVVVLALILFVLGRLPKKPTPASSARDGASANLGKAQQQPANSATGNGSIVPLTEVGHGVEPEVEGNPVHPEQIGRTAKPQPGHSAATTLGDIAPFDNHGWEPPPYQPSMTAPASTGADASEPADATSTRGEHDAMDKASLVFVKNNNLAQGSKPESDPAVPDLGIGFSPGTKLRARLQAAVSTAVETPVVAVIEYNYEQGGEIVVPAGAKAFGRLQAADRSGYVGVRFDSMLLPDGSSVRMEAAATDLALRPLKGKVEGRHTGKNILVRSLAGVGEVAATLAGRSSLNQPLSESDLLRERLSNNIGQTSDEEVARLAFTQHVVVSVPANTEIYVVLEKAASAPSTARAGAGISGVQTTSKSPSMQELRQLLQLQRELNQGVTAANASQ